MTKEKKKCGIISFHTAYNFGAYLQGYTLYKLLKDNLPDYKVEFVNYEIPEAKKIYTKAYFPWLRNIKDFSIVKSTKLVLQYFSFVFARKSFISIGPKITNSDIDKAYCELNDYYDVIVLSGDELWKIDQYRAYPNLYWLSDCITAKKISFCPTANKTEISRFSDNDLEIISASLNSFSLIGVRDKYTEKLVKRFIPKDRYSKVRLVPDPAFLFDYEESAKPYIKKFNNYANSKRKIGIMLPDNELTKNIIDKLKEKNYYIVNLYLFNENADYNLGFMNPILWPLLFKALDGCITSFFHGTVFSMLAKIPFVSMVTNDGRAVSAESKLESLFGLLDMDRKQLLDNSNGVLTEDLVVDKIENIVDHWDYYSKSVENAVIKAKKICNEHFINILSEIK